VDIRDEMNEKGEIARCTPFVELPDAETMGVLVDFRGDAVSVGTSSGQVAFCVLKAQVDIVPWRHGLVRAKLSVRPDRRGLHGFRNRCGVV